MAEEARGNIFFKQKDSSFAIPCKAQGFPLPEFRSVSFHVEGKALSHSGPPRTFISLISMKVVASVCVCLCSNEEDI